MHKRFWIICSVVAVALLTLSLFGVSSLGMHEKGLRAERQQDFITVAEKIRFDIKEKLDIFLQTEQARSYTDYQYYYVPQTANQTAALVRSPLGSSISNGLAYGYFQLDNVGAVATPYASDERRPSSVVRNYLDNIKSNLLPSLGNGESLQVRRIEPSEPKDEYRYRDKSRLERVSHRGRSVPATGPGMSSGVSGMAEPEFQKGLNEVEGKLQLEVGKKVAAKSKVDSSRRSRYPIKSIEEAPQQTQVLAQRRDNYELNVSNNKAMQRQVQMEQADSFQQQVDRLAEQVSEETQEKQDMVSSMAAKEEVESQAPQAFNQPAEVEFDAEVQADMEDDRQQDFEDMVQVRIEPFVPMTVPEANGKESVFAGQVFLLRHIQIEDNHLVQGFRLDELELLSQVTESAQKFIRRGMGFDISEAERADAAYTAVLDFGFGEVVLNLIEQQPGWIQARVVQIRDWFFAILAVVWLAVVIALATFWRNMYEQVQLSRKKDDFISAVSHELRTPLTSIRMYTEMLEKDWVKTEDKRREYYVTMRQESERLSRLIENVLDFSRIQRGKKRYEFTLGDVNECVGDIVQMMRPYAERAGFTLIQEFSVLEPFTFDRDAVVQIVINLLDNALKYAKEAQDRHIIIRTQKQKDYVVIEVEDHGPGIARNQQKKIFEAFYRCGDESTRQTTGTGLGLALVKRFAEAHHGFVEIINAKPTGALFRVGLANHYGK